MKNNWKTLTETVKTLMTMTEKHLKNSNGKPLKNTNRTQENANDNNAKLLNTN